MRDRIDLIADLLLGAAYADDHLHDREKQTIRNLLRRLMQGDVPAALSARVDGFDPKKFDVAACAGAFADDSPLDKRKLLELVAAVHEADEELDLAEDEYLRSVAAALGVENTGLAGLALEYTVEDLQEGLGRLRAGPPPIPRAASDSLDVDVDVDVDPD